MVTSAFEPIRMCILSLVRRLLDIDRESDYLHSATLTCIPQSYAPLVPSQNPGSITTQFSLSNTGTLLWNNDAFFNGNALFCVLTTGQIIAVFQQGANPTGCVFVDLTIVQLTACQSTDATNTLSVPVVLQGNQGPTGPQGVPGVIGATGPQGISGRPGETGATGPSGPQGISGQRGETGAVGPSGPSGATGPQGISGQPGATGASGPSGPSGATGPQGASGLPGATGPAGSSGPSGATGPQGIPGPSGAAGEAGPSGPQGPVGPTGPPSVAYGYLGCFYQSGTSSSTSGKVLSTFITSYSTRANTQCSNVCNSQLYNFYGTVSTGSATDCYCGNIVNYVTVLGLGNGRAPENNCGGCPGGGGPAPAGYCGIATSSTVAIFAHGY